MSEQVQNVVFHHLDMFISRSPWWVQTYFLLYLNSFGKILYIQQPTQALPLDVSSKQIIKLLHKTFNKFSASFPKENPFTSLTWKSGQCLRWPGKKAASRPVRHKKDIIWASLRLKKGKREKLSIHEVSTFMSAQFSSFGFSFHSTKCFENVDILSLFYDSL